MGRQGLMASAFQHERGTTRYVSHGLDVLTSQRGLHFGDTLLPYDHMRDFHKGTPYQTTTNRLANGAVTDQNDIQQS